jgi:hypothetical protein
MGTSLTGLTPATTYDALIKVGDNGPLSATAKVLSDGLGNDSPLALSTTAVGIGTASPSTKLTIVDNSPFVVGSSSGSISVTEETGTTLVGQGGGIFLGIPASSGSFLSTFIKASRETTDGSNSASSLLFGTRAGGGANTERMRITSTGNVGIGTTSPSTKLVISNGGAGGLEIEPSGLVQSYNRSTGAYQSITLDASDILFRPSGTERGRFTANGLTFNGDTAAANALDDYEEGTWTPGFTLDSGSVSAFTSSGSYTKIGRQVSLTISITFTTTLLAEINNITGMPFTAQNTQQIAIGAIRESANTGNLWHLRINANATEGLLRRYDNDQTLANGDTFIGTLTYFV